MKNILKIVFISLICAAIVVAGTYIVAYSGVTNPADVLGLFFDRFEIAYTYDFNSFGEVFRFWSAAALFPMMSELIFTSPAFVGALIPVVLFAVVCFFMGYLYKLPNGISISLIVYFWTLLIGIGVAALVPHALPAIGLPPAEYEFVRGLADELILFTLLAPPNMIGGTVLTLGIGITAAIFGGIFHRLPIPGLSRKTKKKQTKTTKSKKTTAKSSKKTTTRKTK